MYQIKTQGYDTIEVLLNGLNIWLLNICNYIPQGEMIFPETPFCGSIRCLQKQGREKCIEEVLHGHSNENWQLPWCKNK